MFKVNKQSIKVRSTENLGIRYKRLGSFSKHKYIKTAQKLGAAFLFCRIPLDKLPIYRLNHQMIVVIHLYPSMTTPVKPLAHCTKDLQPQLTTFIIKINSFQDLSTTLRDRFNQSHYFPLLAIYAMKCREALSSISI